MGWQQIFLYLSASKSKKTTSQSSVITPKTVLEKGDQRTSDTLHNKSNINKGTLQFEKNNNIKKLKIFHYSKINTIIKCILYLLLITFSYKSLKGLMLVIKFIKVTQK